MSDVKPADGMAETMWYGQPYRLSTDSWREFSAAVAQGLDPIGDGISFYAKLSNDGKEVILSDDGLSCENLYESGDEFAPQHVRAAARVFGLAAIANDGGVELQLQGWQAERARLFDKFAACLPAVPYVLIAANGFANDCKNGAKTSVKEEN